MFFCDKCQHEASSEATLKYHQDTLHQDTTYDCNICGVQVSSKESLIQHKRAVHERILKTFKDFRRLLKTIEDF